MKCKNNLAYFWFFYKWQLLAALVLLALGASFLTEAFRQKECVLSVMLLDCHAEVSQEEMEQEILLALKLDKEEYAVQMQSHLMLDNAEAGGYAMTSISRFLADIGSGKIDVCGMLEGDYRTYDRSGAFLDLRECLNEDQLRILSDALATGDDGRVIGLYADRLPGMLEAGCYDLPDERGIVGIVYNAEHLEQAVRYLLYLSGLFE